MSDDETPWREEMERLLAEIAGNDDNPGFTWSDGSVTFINCRVVDSDEPRGFTFGEFDDPPGEAQ